MANEASLIRSDSVAAPLALSKLHLGCVILVPFALKGTRGRHHSGHGSLGTTALRCRPIRGAQHEPGRAAACLGLHTAWTRPDRRRASVPPAGADGRLTGAEPPLPSPAAGQTAPRSTHQRDRFIVYQKPLWVLPSHACTRGASDPTEGKGPCVRGHPSSYAAWGTPRLGVLERQPVGRPHATQCCGRDADLPATRVCVDDPKLEPRPTDEVQGLLGSADRTLRVSRGLAGTARAGCRSCTPLLQNRTGRGEGKAAVSLRVKSGSQVPGTPLCLGPPSSRQLSRESPCPEWAA